MGGRPRIEVIKTAATVAFDESEGAAPNRLVRSPEPKAGASTLQVRPRPAALRSGMAITEVVSVLGEPDIVTRGSAGREIWVWDALSSARLRLLCCDATPGLLTGAGIARASRESTFTVMVRFDDLRQVSSVSVLASRG